MGALLLVPLPWALAALGGAPLSGLGAWHAGLLGLLLIAALGVFVRPRGRREWAGVMLAALLLAGVPAVVHRGTGSLPAALLVGGALFALAFALGDVARSAQAPQRWSALCFVLLVAALFALHLADPLSAMADEPNEARALRQSLLDWDLATAYAYEGLGHDRFHEAHVYETVPLASSLVALPTASGAGVRYFALALLSLLVSQGARRLRCTS